MSLLKALKQMDSLSDWCALSLELLHTRPCYHHLFCKFHFQLNSWIVKGIQNYPIKKLNLTGVYFF